MTRAKNSTKVLNCTTCNLGDGGTLYSDVHKTKSKSTTDTEHFHDFLDALTTDSDTDHPVTCTPGPSNSSCAWTSDVNQSVASSMIPSLHNKSNSDTYVRTNYSSPTAIMRYYKEYPQVSEPQQGTTMPVKSKENFKCPCNNCSIEDFLQRKCPKSNLTPFPYLDTGNLNKDEKQNLCDHLLAETKHIIMEFSDLVFRMNDSLKLRSTEPRESEMAISSSDELSLLEANALIRRINDHLQNNYISFCNYHIVKIVIEHYGTDEDKESLHKYLTNFQSFCQRSVFNVPQGVFGPVPDDGEKISINVTKVRPNNSLQPPTANSFGDDTSPYSPTSVTSSSSVEASLEVMDLSLKDALIAKEKLAKILGLRNLWSLVYLGATKGSIQLHFSVPREVMSTVKPQIDCKPNLGDSGINILCGPPGKPFVTIVTNGSIWLHWTRPEYGEIHSLKHYRVHYQSLGDLPKDWTTLNTAGSKESVILSDLSQTYRTFIFKVQAVNETGLGTESEESDLVILLTPVCKETCTNNGVSVYSLCSLYFITID